MPAANQSLVGLGRIAPRFRQYLVWFMVVVPVPFWFLGHPCTDGWPQALLRCQCFAFSLGSFVAWRLFNRGIAYHVTAFRLAWMAPTIAFCILSRWWCLGHLQWFAIVGFNSIAMCIGVTLTCGTGSVEHSALSFAAAAFFYLQRPAMEGHVLHAGSDASRPWVLTFLASLFALTTGLCSIGVLSFKAFKRKVLAILQIISTPLSELEMKSIAAPGLRSMRSGTGLRDSSDASTVASVRELQGNRTDVDASASTSESVRKPSKPLKPDLSRSVAGVKPNRSPFEDVVCKQLVGRGAFGRVYLGSWGGTDVAVKVIEHFNSDKFLSCFEGELAATLSHPCLVQTFKHSSGASHDVAGVPRGVDETWIVQEWCDLGTLANMCVEPLPSREVVGVALDITAAGAYLHSRGIIHGDLTAGNILLKSNQSVGKGYRCKIGDFGLARILEGETTYLLTTQLGTVTHMPPELFSTDTTVLKLSKSADIYAFGMLLYQALAGKAPYCGLSGPQVIMQVASGKRLEVPQGTVESISAIYGRCTSSIADQRPCFEDVLGCFEQLAKSLDC